jgi:hypothetical protein
MSSVQQTVSLRDSVIAALTTEHIASLESIDKMEAENSFVAQNPHRVGLQYRGTDFYQPCFNAAVLQSAIVALRSPGNDIVFVESHLETFVDAERIREAFKLSKDSFASHWTAEAVSFVRSLVKSALIRAMG